MKISENGLKLIKEFEGCKLTAYKATSSEKYYTIGYGHYGPDVTKGQRITQATADKLLKTDVIKYEGYVNNLLDTYTLNQNQFDALVSFTFNCGKQNLLLLTANKTRTLGQISEKMILYSKSNGIILRGLVRRREAEQKLFNTPCKSTLKSNEQIADEVIQGLWGNGVVRKTRLESAGYNYLAVQKLVNKKLGGK